MINTLNKNIKMEGICHVSWDVTASCNINPMMEKNTLLGYVVVTEKLDGHYRTMDQNGVFIPGHNEPSIAYEDMDLWMLQTSMIEFLQHKNLKMHFVNLFYQRDIVYTRLRSSYYLIGISSNDKFLAWHETEKIASYWNLPLIPVLFKGNLSAEYQQKLKKITEPVMSCSKLGASISKGYVVRSALEYGIPQQQLRVLQYQNPNFIQKRNNTRIRSHIIM